MAHQRLADFLHHSCFHEPCVERVPEIVETEIADARSTNSRLPSGLCSDQGLAFERKEQALFLSIDDEELVDTLGEGNFAGLAPGGL